MQLSWSLSCSPPYAFCHCDVDIRHEVRSGPVSRCGLGFMTEPVFLSDLPALPVGSLS